MENPTIDQTQFAARWTQKAIRSTMDPERHANVPQETLRRELLALFFQPAHQAVVIVQRLFLTRVLRVQLEEAKSWGDEPLRENSAGFKKHF